MKLEKLIVHRLPGMPGGFEIKTEATVNAIIGPNGSGKSSLTRAVRHLLWSEGSPGTPFSVEAFFNWDGASWKAVREEGMKTRWMREGLPVEAPELPGDHVARCYEMGLLDLVLPAGGEVEQQLAGIINQEMSGGVNLAQISDEIFSFGPRIASKKSSQLKEASNSLGRLLRQQKQLFEQEKELAEKQLDLERSNNAATVFGLLEKLKERNEILIELEAVRFQLNTFDQGQAMVRQEDNDTLAALSRMHQEKTRQAQQTGTELDIRREKLKSLVLPDQMTGSGILARQVAEAVSLDGSIQKLQENLTRQEALLGQTLKELDPAADGDAAGPQPGREIYTDVTKAYSRLAELQALSEGLDALLALPELQFQDPDPQSKAALGKLRLWLESPPTDSGAPALTGLLAALVASAAGWLLLSSSENSMGIVAMVLGAGLAGYSAWRWFQIQSWKKRHHALGFEVITLCSEAKIPLEKPLQRDQVRSLLEDESCAEAARQTRKALKENLSGQHIRQNQKLEQSQEFLEHLRSEHGLALDREMPDLINLLNIIPRFRAARDEAAALSAATEQKQLELGSILKTCGSTFAKLGFNQPTTATEAQQLLDELELRLSERHRLQEEIQKYLEDQRRLQLDLKEVGGSLEAFWNRLGLEPQKDDHLVRNLVNNLSRWQETMAEESNLKQHAHRLDQGFRTKPDLLDPAEAEKLSDEELDHRLESLRTSTLARDDIVKGITRISMQVDQARGSLQVAEARAFQESARTALKETRDQERQSALGRLLLEDVQQTYHHASRPKVLALASDNFKDFTQGQYELRVVPGRNLTGRFSAFDVEKKENLGLAELSDGTRAQLLLAVRLGFIATNEGAAKPPIFLDESLTSSDPQRFAAIADKLAGWAGSQQRQVFYLSSNPHDAKAWESALANSDLPDPKVLDLAEARRLGSGQPPSFDFETPPSPSAPDQMSPGQYARVLGVPGLNPWRQNTETHLWYILQDDLPQLHRLLLASVSTVGKLLSRKDELVVLADMDSQKLTNLEARCRGLDAFFRNWRVGRNRPITAETLINSDAVGPTFMDKCRDLLDEVDGDSAEFLEGLRGKKVKRFASRKIDELEDYFLQENYLDPRNVLTREDLLSHVFSAVEPEIKAGAVEITEVRTFVLSWWEILRPAS